MKFKKLMELIQSEEAEVVVFGELGERIHTAATCLISKDTYNTEACVLGVQILMAVRADYLTALELKEESEE